MSSETGSRQKLDETDKKIWFPILLLLFLILLPVIQFVGSYNYLIHLFLYAFLYITMTTSWNIIGGYGGFISLGHNVFLCVGAYIAGYSTVRFGVSPFQLILISAFGASVFGFIVGLITLRVRGPSFIISSIALVMILRIVFDHWDMVGGASGITLPYSDLPVEWSKIPHYYAFLGIATVSILLNWYVKHSKFGLALRALAHDEVRSEVAGINVRLIKVTAFSLSTFCIGAAGAVWADYLTYIRPNMFLIILIAANIVLMCILGGKGTVTGPIVGAITLIIFNEIVITFFGATELNIMLTGILLVGTLLFFPNGIVGTLKKRNRLPNFLDWD